MKTTFQRGSVGKLDIMVKSKTQETNPRKLKGSSQKARLLKACKACSLNLTQGSEPREAPMKMMQWGF